MRKINRWWKSTSIHKILNKEFNLVVKHVLLALSFMLFTLFSFFWLTTSQTAQACRDRNSARLELKSALLYMVDLRDLLVDSPVAELYTQNRKAYINSTPSLQPLKC